MRISGTEPSPVILIETKVHFPIQTLFLEDSIFSVERFQFDVLTLRQLFGIIPQSGFWGFYGSSSIDIHTILL